MPARTHNPIDDRTRDILRGAVVDGVHVTIPQQLAPADYAKVKRALTALGGPWNRRVQAHVFTTDPRPLLTAALGGGVVPAPARTTDGYVPTPAAFADALCRYPYLDIAALPPGATVLEPSAGEGALVHAILRANAHVRVGAVEPDAERAARIVATPTRVAVFHGTLETVADAAAKDPGMRRYDAVVMNPPFAVPGNQTIWVDHVRLAYGLLAPGGRLVSVAPHNLTFRSDRRHADMRAMVAELGGWNEPPGTFAESGTKVGTVVLWLDKPE